MNDTTQKIATQKLDYYNTAHAQSVTLEKQSERHAIVKYMARETKMHIKKLPGNKYMVLSTREVKDMAENCGKQKQSLLATFDELRGLIRTNFDNEGQNQVFLTLTYRENMTNIKRAYDDFEFFWKKVVRHCKCHELAYINVVEPQGRGAWHFHVMIKSLNQKELWIDKNKIKDLWGRERGNAYIERLKGDDVGAYYVAYFTTGFKHKGWKEADLNVGEEVHNPESADRMKLLDKVKKGQIKGERLHMYPKNTQFFRCSRNIARPVKSKVTHEQVEAFKAKHGLDKPAHQHIYAVNEVDEDMFGGLQVVQRLNVIAKEQYRVPKPGKKPVTENIGPESEQMTLFEGEEDGR